MDYIESIDNISNNINTYIDCMCKQKPENEEDHSNYEYICFCKGSLSYISYISVTPLLTKKELFRIIKVINDIFSKICVVNHDFNNNNNYIEWTLIHILNIDGIKYNLDNASINIQLIKYNEDCLRIVFRLDNSLTLSQNIKNELEIYTHNDIDEMYSSGYNFITLDSVKQALNDESMFLFACYTISELIKKKLQLFTGNVSK